MKESLVTEKSIIIDEDTLKAIGFELGALVKKGSIIALIGDLGAGKTTFTKEFARGLNIKDDITSPTFNIVSIYDEPNGRLPLYHFDVYRLSCTQELEDIGYEEYFYGNGVTVIEWANKIESILDENTIYIFLDYVDMDKRKLTIKTSDNKIIDLIN